MSLLKYFSASVSSFYVSYLLSSSSFQKLNLKKLNFKATLWTLMSLSLLHHAKRASLWQLEIGLNFIIFNQSKCTQESWGLFIHYVTHLGEEGDCTWYYAMDKGSGTRAGMIIPSGSNLQISNTFEELFVDFSFSRFFLNVDFIGQ